MDRLPLVPKNEEDHDVLPLTTEIFQEVFRAPKYPKNVAENYKKYKVDVDFNESREAGLITVKILEALDASLDDITNVEKEIMQNHALAIVQKNKNIPFYEELRLKRVSLFQKLSNYAIQAYGLIQREDLYPNFIQQYLDFTYNPSLHTCDPCALPEEPEVAESLPKKKRKKPKQPEPLPIFRLEPDKVVFYNYELGKTYKEKFKLRNISKTTQYFYYFDFPKESNFRLTLLADSTKVAPGMAAEFLVTFQTQTYKDYKEVAKFKTANGDIFLMTFNVREPPTLVCYVINPILPLNAVEKPGPGSQYFSERRRTACNFSIDCGTCLLGSYSIVTVIMQNSGQKGRFFVTTENEWVFNELNDSDTRSLELTQGAFTIFPTYFEIDENGFGQLCVCFVPDNVEFYSEKLFIICDNYAHQEVELLGDGILFDDHFIKVDMYIVEDTFSYSKQVINITLAPFQSSGFVLSVINESPINFEYFWALKTNVEERQLTQKMHPSWIEILNPTKLLPSFSTTDVVIKVTPQTEQQGPYYMYLGFYLKNVPIRSVMNDEFVVRNKGQVVTPHACDDLCTPVEETRSRVFDMSNKLADVHIFELGVICEVKIPPVTPPCTPVSLPTEQCKTYPKLAFSEVVLNFGVIPVGYQTSKHFYVINLTDEEVNWKIAPITGDNLTCENYKFRICTGKNTLSQLKGSLRTRRRRKITYTVQAKECVRRLDILVLFSAPCDNSDEYSVQSVCLVAYEVAEINVSIYSKNCDKAIICPKEFIYVGIPTLHILYVHNSGILTGCFYFLKPIGPGADKIRLKFNPQSGVVQPDATIEVKVQLVVFDTGVFDNVQVPCFVGNSDKLIRVNVLCTVAGTNLFFYLPGKDKGYNRLVWPPRTQQPTWDYDTSKGEDWQDGGEWTTPTDTPTIDPSLLDLVAADSVAITYPTVKTKKIHVKQRAKLTFYMENLTPIGGHFRVNPTNYSPENECLNHILVKAKTRSPEFFWDKACLDGYGIVVEVERPCGDIVAYEVVEIHLWIYANTWGKYLEEVMVEVNDLTPFCFNLLIEVVGLPIEFPFARNSCLPVPQIRFENVAYMSANNVKGFTVTNISAVPVEVSWHVFTRAHDGTVSPLNIILEFEENRPRVDMASKFFGFEACTKCICVTPCSFVVEKQSTVTVSVAIAADGFVSSYDRTNLKYDLHGFIGLQKCDKFKENYFMRPCGMNAPHAKIQVLATLELPIMQVDVSSDETTIDIFVNDISLSHYKIPEVYLILRNVDTSVVNFKIDIEKPFLVVGARTVPSGITDTENLVLNKDECLQIIVTCHFSWQDLLDYADLIYQHDDSEGIDKAENFISVVSKTLNVYQQGTSRQMIPFMVRLHYPHIEVKPTFLKFGHCLLYRTKKTVFTIYNMTASLIRYEIFKTTNHDDFEVHPSHGEIARSTGVNHQFVDVTVYFTPRHCKLYLESLRVTTNFPQYYIDVPVTGYGSNDEKFNV